MKVPDSYPSLILDDESAAFSRSLILALQQHAFAINVPDSGTTAARPTQKLVTGQFYFDTTIGKPIWWNGAVPHWVDATGANV